MDLDTITPQLKDDLLKALVDNCRLESICKASKPDLIKLSKINDTKLINAILQQFGRMGLLEKAVENKRGFDIILRIKAIDFFNRGGFVIQEELLVKNIEKLLNEIENLKPNTLEQTNYIASIATAILTAYNFLVK